MPFRRDSGFNLVTDLDPIFELGPAIHVQAHFMAACILDEVEIAFDQLHISFDGVFR